MTQQQKKKWRWSRWESEPGASVLYWALVIENKQDGASLYSSAVLDTISIKEVDLSYYGTYQSINYKLAYEFIFHSSIYKAPLEVFICLKDIFFFKKSRIK